MKAYPEYKDSGVEYLGQIPSEWTIKPLKHIAEIGPSVPKDLNADLDRLVSFIPMENLGTNGDLDTSIQKHASEVRQGYSFFAEGDVIFAKVTPCFENGKSAIARNLCNGYGFGTTELYVLRPKMVRTKFLFYLISSYIFRLPGASHMLGAGGLKRVSTNYVEYFKSPTPSDIEQKAIANFLDRETSRIDKLIAEKQNFIKLLKEKRQALISHVVTKGLDPNVKMKDSGIEWIAEVPVHWGLIKFSHFVSIRNGQVDPTEEPWSNFILIAPNHVESSSGRIIKKETAREQGADSGKYLCKKGEVIYSKIRPGLAKACICEDEETICSADMYPLNCDSRMLNEYLLWLILSNEFTRNAILESDRVAMPKINRESLAKIKFPVPPINEQLSALSFIHEHTLRLEKIIEETNTSIDLLKEHRTALISAAVTGKIDVRNYKEEAA
ncbi:restriction endonuclease subunit S [Methylotuvimicrobium buryatense]|uniref:Restriction endonuclease subunit S n=1 Tax=Methylotuvimicrobium buryatense TaxID=95641 RepID=A0A4P9UQL7_METBY|nr:restriction endonuclease subunit S [Methylotuvimicrobium buryatense]QCW81896.1 restriction endonuclease subunit S [Methylotuvimicrobium buryatense]